jgi:DNA-binding MarR family transcriptional regulator
MDREDLIQGIIENLARCQKVPANLSAWQKIGLSHAQVGMLFMILHHSDANVKQISEYLGITKSAVTQLMEPLVNKGYVSRQNDARDRRIVRLNLTASGKKTLKEIGKAKFAGMRSALANLSDKDLEQLAKLHQKASGNIATK